MSEPRQTLDATLAMAFPTLVAGVTKLRAENKRLRAELEQAEKARDEWVTPFDGSGTEWHESLPSPYTYQASDFSKLVAAVHEYEAALREVKQ
jgi:hypothetical protein